MAKPWRILDSIATDEGLLDLRQRRKTDLLITINGRVLMNSSANMSEIVLAELACESLRNKKKPRVLVGGLGMGFTLKAALDNLPTGAEVVVAELNPIIVEWCRGPIAHYKRAPGRGEYLYGDMALELSRSALKADGVFAVWSEDPDKAFEKR